MTTTFKSFGKQGDIIFSLPTIRELGGGILYLPKDGPESKGILENMRDLLLQQPYITEVKEYASHLGYGEQVPDVLIDYDLDDARLQPAKGIIHIVRRYLDAFQINIPNWKEPWLHVDGDSVIEGQYTVFNYTGRHIINEQLNIRSSVNWKEVFDGVEGRKVFVGSGYEYGLFSKLVGKMDYITTKDALQLARIIKGAKAVYCNQSLVLALAQGLGKEYYVEVKPGKSNCILGVKNEHIL